MVYALQIASKDFVRLIVHGLGVVSTGRNQRIAQYASWRSINIVLLVTRSRVVVPPQTQPPGPAHAEREMFVSGMKGAQKSRTDDKRNEEASGSGRWGVGSGSGDKGC